MLMTQKPLRWSFGGFQKQEVMRSFITPSLNRPQHSDLDRAQTQTYHSGSKSHWAISSPLQARGEKWKQ